VPLLEYLIRIFTDIDDVVIDCCAGSGTTLLAAKNTGRRAYGFELMKEYVDAFYQKILPCAKEDMFTHMQRKEKARQLELTKLLYSSN
jgi:site-specific DNA-methyltransferase (adenine-specific)